MNVGVSACTISVVVDSFTRTTLATSTSKMLGIYLHLFLSKGTSSPGTSGLVSSCETTIVESDICVPACAVSVVDFCASCTC